MSACVWHALCICVRMRLTDFVFHIVGLTRAQSDVDCGRGGGLKVTLVVSSGEREESSGNGERE